MIVWQLKSKFRLSSYINFSNKKLGDLCLIKQIEMAEEIKKEIEKR